MRIQRASAAQGKGRVTLTVKFLLVMVLLTLLPGKLAWAHDPSQQPTDVLRAIGFDQHLATQAPLDAPFMDERGQHVQLGDYFHGKPVILLLGYFQCPNLCPLEREGLVNALQKLNFTVGKDFDVVMISIDPKETPAIATKVKQQSIATYARPGTEVGWHFLTGEHAAIDRVADKIGFRYLYIADQKEYAHPSGIVILTPAGKIARYLFGIAYEPFDLRLGLVETAAARIGTPIDQFLLLCFHYNPTTGKYSLFILNLMRLVAVATVLGIGLWVWTMLRRMPAQSPLAS